jgi:hypothetical protein
MKLVVQSQAQQTLLPIADYLISPKLVFCMKSNFIGELEGSKIRIPTNLIGCIQPIILPKCWVKE